VVGKTHRNRIAMTAAETATASTTIDRVDIPLMPSMTLGSCSPTSTKSTALSTKTRISQTEKAWMRVAGVMSWGERQPR
jgi:hypothetical protein